MSVVNVIKARAVTSEDIANFLANGNVITVGKKKKRCPKYLRLNGHTANGKNDAPTFNPLKHMV